MADASSAAGGGAVPSEVSAVSTCNWPRKRSVRSVGARKVRQELRARKREGLEPQVDVALAADRLASWRFMMFASVVIFLALPFFGANTICFHGIDVRPVIFGATCCIASANDGAPCKRLGRVCK